MKIPPFTSKEKLDAIKWVETLKNHKGQSFCTICEVFSCTCSSSDCFKITHSESVIAFLRYVYNIREDELKDENNE